MAEVWEKFRVVPGAISGSDRYQAVKNGEIVGRADDGWAAIPVGPIVIAATANRAAPIATSTRPDRPPTRRVMIFPDAIRSSNSRVMLIV